MNPGGLNILLVEDHPDTAALLKACLQRCGHRVALAGTRQQGLAQPELARMEVLICDIGLPDGSGWDLLPELRAKAGQAYAVAISARGLASGFQAHLAKPFTPPQLLELLTGRRGEAAVRSRRGEASR